MYYAQLKNGTVFAETETHSELPASDDLVLRESNYPSVLGYTYDGESFHPPVAVEPLQSRTLTKLKFLRLLTQDERIAIRAAAKVDPVVEDFMALLDLAEDVDKDDDDVIAGLTALTFANLLAAGRAEEILS